MADPITRVVRAVPLFQGAFNLHLPKGAEILGAEMLLDGAALLVLVDPAASMETRAFVVVSTEDRFDAAGLTYVGSYVNATGFAGHVFERIREESDRG